MKTFFDEHIYVQTTAQELKDLRTAVSNLCWAYQEEELEGSPEVIRYKKLLQDLDYMLAQQPWW